MKILLTEILKAQDSLSHISFSINKKEFNFYYRYLTILEHMRVEQMCVKRIEELREDGTTSVKFEKNDKLYPIYLLLEKCLDNNGIRLFSHTSKDDYKTITNLPYKLVSYIANEMGSDIFGSVKND